MTARKGPEERRRLRGERPRSTAAATLFAPCPRARTSARRDALNGVFLLTVQFMPAPGARGTDSDSANARSESRSASPC